MEDSADNSQSSFDSYVPDDDDIYNTWDSDNEDSSQDDFDATADVYNTWDSDNEDSSQDDWSEPVVVSYKRRNTDNRNRGGASTSAKRRKQDYNQSLAHERRVQLLLAGIDYQHQHRGTWLQVRIPRSAEAEPVGSFNERAVCVYNTATLVSKDLILTKFKDSIFGKELFYHGTSRDSAKCIIEKGIDVTMSDRHVDFSAGKGFYVTDNYDKACNWSQRKAIRGSKPAVVVFKIDNDMGRNETHLTLKVDNVTNRKFWECIVSHFRRGETSPDVTRVLEDVKYIEGPVAKNTNLTGDEIPTPHDNGSFFQLCICDQGYARKFGGLANILCVIFITD